MLIEHIAFNVSDPVQITEWYVQNLEFKIVKSMNKPPFTHFLKDKNGVMIEVYSNPINEVPDYKAMHPLILHLAFVSKNPKLDRERLEKAGATFFEEQKFPDGTHLIMMKDPWGLSIQLCKRGQPFT